MAHSTKKGYRRLSRDRIANTSNDDMELTDPLVGGSGSFPERYLKHEAQEDDDDEGALYHEKSWPADRRIWRRRWCDWRIILLISLALLVFGLLVFAIALAPAPVPNNGTSAYPSSFGTNLGCQASNFYLSPNANYTAYNTTVMTVPVPDNSFTLTVLGWIATGTITLAWDSTLPSTAASLEFSIASQDPTFDFTARYAAQTGGFYLEVYDEANDLSNCAVYNLTLRLPSSVQSLSVGMQTRGQVRFAPPMLGAVLDDGTAPAAPHVLQELDLRFSDNRTSSLLLLGEGFRAEKALIQMTGGQLTGSWPMPKILNMTVGPDVDIGAGFEFYPFDG